jgi:hypothetical protein
MKSQRCELLLVDSLASMYITPQETFTARKEHRCTWCGEKIVAGEQYTRWMSVDAGEAFSNKMHGECLDAASYDENGEWDYMPFSNDRPRATS